MSGSGDGIIEEIRSRLNIVDVVSDYLAIRRVGKNFVGLCPFHTEDTPSFTVSPEKQIFYCFGCHAGGDVFTFVMQKEGLDFKEALALLAQRAGVTLPRQNLSPAQRRELERRQAILAALEQAAVYFQQLLRTDPGARPIRQYISHRGISAETITDFRLGWSDLGWSSLVDGLRRDGFTDQVLLAAGLGAKTFRGKLIDRFRGRLMIPITDIAGRVIGFGARAMNDRIRPKYLNSPESPVFVKRQTLFALDRARSSIRQTGKVLIVEGYMDAITAHQAGLTFTVASLGTALSEEQIRRIAGLAGRVYVAYDGDAAGQQATLRGLELFSQISPGTEVYIVRLPKGEDPDSYIRNFGVKEFLAAMDKSQPLLDYVFEQAYEQFNAEHPEGKAKIVSAVVPWLSVIKNEVVKSEYIRQYADRLQVDEAALRAELRKREEKSRFKQVNKQERRINVKNGHKPRGDRHTINVAGGSLIQNSHNQLLPAHVRAERELLRIMVNCPEQAYKIAERIAVDDFIEDVNKTIAETIFRLITEREAKDGTELGDIGYKNSWELNLHDHLHHPEARKLVGQWLFEGIPEMDLEAVVDGCVAYLRRYRMERQAEKLWRTIEQLERKGQEVPGNLLEEYYEIQRGLRK